MQYGDGLYETRPLGRRMTPIVRGLLLATAGVFVVQLMMHAAGRDDWIIRALALNPDLVSRFCVWQLLTYVFLHAPGRLFHILFNMLALYFFGPDIETRLGGRRFLFFYLSAGVFAGLVSFLGGSPAGGAAAARPTIGASGAVMAVLVAFALYFPHARVILYVFPMRAATLVIILVVVNLWAAANNASGGVDVLAHLGGAAWGFAFVWLGPRLAARLLRFLDRSTVRQRRRDVTDTERMDAILDKIHRDGMGAVARREKRFLKRVSKQRRS